MSVPETLKLKMHSSLPHSCYSAKFQTVNMHLHVLVTVEVDQFRPVLCMAEVVLLDGSEPLQVLHVLRTASSAKLLPSAQEFCTRGQKTRSLNEIQYATQHEVTHPAFSSEPSRGTQGIT